MPDPVDAAQVTAPDPSAGVQTQGAPIQGGLTPPTPQPMPNPTAAAPPEQPAPAGSFFHNLSHAFTGAILGSMATREVIPPRVNPDTGEMQAPVSQKATTGDMLRTMARGALTGLAAGSQVSPQKSGSAQALAGLGGGFSGEENQIQAKQQLERKQASEDFERNQQMMLNKSNIARQNALTMNSYFENKKTLNDMTPAFKEYGTLIDAMKNSPDFKDRVQEMTGEQVMKLQAADPHFSSTHIVKPLGWAPVTDENGEPVLGPNGEPQSYMRMGVVNGTEGGKVPVTPDLAKKIKEYGPGAGVNVDGIKSGDSYELSSILPLMNAVDEQQKNVLGGWKSSTVGLQTGPDGKPVAIEVNGFDKQRTRPLIATPLSVPEEEAKTAQERAAAKESLDKGQEALANAAYLTNGLNTSTNDAAKAVLQLPQMQAALNKMSDSQKAIMRSLNPKTQVDLIQVANGDAERIKVFPVRVTKGSGQMDAETAEAFLPALNADYTDGLAMAKQSQMKEYSDPSKGAGLAISSFNQFLEHSAQALDAVKNLQNGNSPWLNTPVNELRQKAKGDPAVGAAIIALDGARDEWQSFINSNRAATADEKNAGKELVNDSLSLGGAYGVLNAMGKQSVSRLGQVNDAWKTAWHSDFPNLIHPGTQDAANKLGLGNDVAKYKSGGNFGGVAGTGGSAGVPNASSQNGQGPVRPANVPPNYTYNASGPHGAGWYDPALLGAK